ncbi:enoyl-ACP reductase [Streptomyces abyssalis]|uniref:Enoyl-ACP reductase n=1 Tax=Streptomyces abyssalis TaxID=933944 RepID=A0A1E7JP16_9ACTN|nr:saccharopine dehydrogenase NADP-binding domain-containing protein [Streptomyces abyssalis]OEU86633.1 enoyl-ACP reductase [Streptomyces abyssalis]OEU89980.1 enoyl-ACP reductase [Streptomyces abyssalis]OEV28701.1 enoyl-ACP reductase [Streptomyces nanshensis]
MTDARETTDSTPRRGARDIDVTVYGATGFVGSLVAHHLARTAPEGTRIALAGRSEEKLTAVRESLGERARDWPLFVAEAHDRSALEKMAGAAHVVITTVGPYASYGRDLVGICARAGTDYVDLCGEALFVRESIDAHHEAAASAGARIVHACGFDSVPSDVNVHLLHEKVRADGNGELTDTTAVLTAVSGGVSGGTIDSVRQQIDVMKRDRDARRLAMDPYTLSPDRTAEPELGRQDDLFMARAAKSGTPLRGVLAPFPMAPFNTRIVRRSAALRGHAYGARFRYREAMRLGSPLVSPLVAVGAAGVMGALFTGLALRPTRPLMDKALPEPGEGPGRRTRERGHFTFDTFAVTTTGARYAARFRAQGDPGYNATAVMLGESALALVLDRAGLPHVEGGGGVLTPATGIGDALVGRLRGAGMTIAVRSY